jgi:hypothetical protein
MSEGNHGLFANPDGMNQDGKRIFEAADYADEMVSDASAAREQHGVPWGENHSYSRQMQGSLGEAEMMLWELLPMLPLSLRQSAENALGTSGNLGMTEQGNIDMINPLKNPRSRR